MDLWSVTGYIIRWRPKSKDDVSKRDYLSLPIFLGVSARADDGFRIVCIHLSSLV